MDAYQQLIHVSRYARYDEELGRRETWEETVRRYFNFWVDRGKLDKENADILFQAVWNLEVMPSMRALMTAGPALERDNVAGFNCSYLVVDTPRAFDELMYILLCGTGVGFSVERVYVKAEKMPEVSEEFHETDSVIHVSDSKIGWAKAFRELVSLLYAGQIPSWDVSKVRRAGEPLKTFGGRASGPEPLERLFVFSTALFQKAAGRRLTTLECHDLCCKIAEVVVVGGVRRSALISLSDPTDDRLRSAKTGNFGATDGQRYLANNSAAYARRPDFEFFMKEMVALHESKSGERGLFSREAAQKVAARNGRRDSEAEFGTNPCSEIILRPNQFCNLTEVVVRAEDTLQTLKEKVEKATILGTLQATLTDFRYLRKIWTTNTEDEALLGVSLTGIMDKSLFAGEQDERRLRQWLRELREVAIETNAKWSKMLGINPAAAITCIKPSGTVSQLVNSASGIHPRYADYYIRTIRQDINDPVTTYLRSVGVPNEPGVANPNEVVFSFPIASPKGCVTADKIGAIRQLELWKLYQEEWCEHKPSCTVYYTDDEFFSVCQWLWDNFELLSGVSLLPYDDHVYEQAPYQPITKEQYEEAKAAMPELDFTQVVEYSDNTEGSQTLACVGGACEI
jgi:ribonucleoside-diphosphate reductase alpha chain